MIPGKMCEVIPTVNIKQEHDPIASCCEFINPKTSIKQEPIERDNLTNEQSNGSENTVSISDVDEEDDDVSSPSTEESPTDFDCSITGVILPSIALPLYPSNIPRCGNRLTTITSKKAKKPDPDGHILCKICGDKASGFHYGVFSCEGCKGFFRRSVRQNLVYKPCSTPKRCLIMRISRNRCQFCRMHRCIDSGMSHESVRLGRCPKKDKPSRFNFFKLPQGAVGTDVEKQIRTEQMILCIHEAFRGARKEFDLFTDKYSAAPIIPVQTDSDAKKLCSRFLPAMVLFTTYFAKDVPEFTRLQETNQKLLIRESFMETCAVLSSHSSDVDSYDLIADKFRYYVHHETCYKMGPFGDFFHKMFTTIQKLRSLEMTDVELSILAAVILFCPDRPGVGESFHLEKMEEDLTLALKCQFLLNHGQCDKLFPKTVEILVDLRSISTMHSEKILNSTVEVDSDD
ncbi:unnamed protein product [Mytilus coruscus]|uniref:Uncharacterized protein n=1 Tax=Mytilus coruscus TaxID=42192 RepID=A0A6J8CWH7_MYTCO|nr:unnamed protein product [Mytilus coruscus]